MEILVSSRCNLQSLSEKYIFPEEIRPGKVAIALCESIPVIDLGDIAGQNRANIAQEILKASQEFGFFQVINHGVSKELMNDTMSVFKEVFEMPAEDLAGIYSEDPDRSCRLFTSSNSYASEDVHNWRDFLRHPCHPDLDACIQQWPEKPTRYRQVVGNYSTEVMKLASGILELITEGLGLESRYFGGDVCGLQVFKDGEWIGVGPVPNAFVINIGYQLQIISNNKLKGAEHRAVTNSKDARTSAAFFVSPSRDSIVEPARELIKEDNRPLYRAFEFTEFFSNYMNEKGNVEVVLEPFKLQA
uniref:Fe2OG dioxygenase domain-containing protein n=1 Tax=Populus trichocarpa TaxID=3694 RepID=A0A3N7EGW2_POPTR